jgi:hypothetical protein
LVAVVAVSTGLWAQSAVANVRSSPGYESRRWAERLDASFPAESPPFLRVPVVRHVVPFGFFPWNMTDAVVPSLHPGTRFTDEFSEGVWTVGRDGTAGPAEFVPSGAALDVGLCAAGHEVPVPAAAGASGTFLLVDYSGADPGRLLVQQDRVTLPTVTGSSGRLLLFLFRDLEPGTLTITSLDGSICVDSVQPGTVQVR